MVKINIVGDNQSRLNLEISRCILLSERSALFSSWQKIFLKLGILVQILMLIHSIYEDMFFIKESVANEKRFSISDFVGKGAVTGDGG